MASFINLMADDIWSEKDITNRTEAMVRSVISADDEVILNRKITGVILSQWVMSEEDLALQSRFAAVLALAHQTGIEARADMALLQKALDHESGVAISENPAVLVLVDQRLAFKNPTVESEVESGAT